MLMLKESLNVCIQKDVKTATGKFPSVLHSSYQVGLGRHLAASNLIIYPTGKKKCDYSNTGDFLPF